MLSQLQNISCPFYIGALVFRIRQVSEIIIAGQVKDVFCPSMIKHTSFDLF